MKIKYKLWTLSWVCGTLVILFVPYSLSQALWFMSLMGLTVTIAYTNLEEKYDKMGNKNGRTNNKKE